MKAVRGLSLAVAMFACAPFPQTGDVISGSGGGTSAAITPADLSVRMYTFAHDSMTVRVAATEGGLKAARTIFVAKSKGVDPTVTQLAAAMDPKGTANADGIDIPKVLKDDGVTLHRFFTFKDPAGDCATATAAVTDPVTCVKQ